MKVDLGGVAETLLITREEFFDLPNYPKNPDMGGRKAGFSREIFMRRRPH